MGAFKTVGFGGRLHTLKPYGHDQYGQESKTVGVIGHLRPPESKCENQDQRGAKGLETSERENDPSSGYFLGCYGLNLLSFC